MEYITTPQAWYAADMANGSSWVQRLTDEEIAGFDVALEHA